MPTDRSTFLLSLRRAMLDDFEADLTLACRWAVLQAAGFKRSEIARTLAAAGTPALRVAEARVKRAAIRLDQGDREA